MWKIEDFWKIFNFLKTDEPNDLSDSLQAISKSELAKSEEFFINTLDQLSFSSTEYKRLRNFLIDWYSSVKTLTAVQKEITDIYALPDTHLDEAFRSKGFNFSTQLSRYGPEINYNKGNFYYDLVNLYKKKGSPRTLLNTLRYFGFPNLEVIEYMTYIRKSTQKVEFHSLSADYTGNWWTTNIDILNYTEVTQWDPHYLTSERSIIKGQNNSKLHLPTKSPYFTLRHFINLNDYSKLTSYLSRKIQDQYSLWHDSLSTDSTIVLPKELYIDSCSLETSVLELYLSCIYIYYKNYSTETIIQHPTNSIWNVTSTLGNPNGTYFNCYNGTDTSYLNLVSDFEAYIESIPLSRDEVSSKLSYFYDLFARVQTSNFLITDETAGDVLQLLNPALYTQLNSIYDIQPNTIILGDLLEDLMKWVSSYITVNVPHLNYLLYGTSEFKRILSPLVDFFKPYHARLLSYDIAFIGDNRNTESVIVDDIPIDSIEEIRHDFDTSNSQPCTDEEGDSDYSRNTYDCGSNYDIGAASDIRPEALDVTITDTIENKLTCQIGFTDIDEYQNPESIKYGVDPYVETDSINIPSEYIEVQSGNFLTFDDGGCFDNHYGNDVCMIQVIG